MKSFIAKYKWHIIAFVVIFLVAIPFLINYLFKLNCTIDILNAEWSAGEFLSFYGAILASATTIAGVYISIQYAQHNYREDEINRVKPYFALTHYRVRARIDMINSFIGNSGSTSDNTDNESYYEEYAQSEVYVIIDYEGIHFLDKLSEEHQKLIKMCGIHLESNGKGTSFVKTSDYISMPFEAQNVGNGAAINTVLIFYEKGKERRGNTLYTKKKNDTFHVHLLCTDTSVVADKEFIMELEYGDILGNKYSQKYPIEFKRNESNGRIDRFIDMAGKQTPINK